jgi:hypothetical protein
VLPVWLHDGYIFGAAGMPATSRFSDTRDEVLFPVVIDLLRCCSAASKNFPDCVPLRRGGEFPPLDPAEISAISAVECGTFRSAFVAGFHYGLLAGGRAVDEGLSLDLYKRERHLAKGPLACYGSKKRKAQVHREWSRLYADAKVENPRAGFSTWCSTVRRMTRFNRADNGKPFSQTTIQGAINRLTGRKKVSRRARAKAPAQQTGPTC